MLSILLLSLILADPDPIMLFNGKNHDNWTITTKLNADGSKTWSVKDGILHCTGKPNGYLATKGVYENYRLTLKWRFPEGTEKANGGVLLHVQSKDEYWPQSVEAQMKMGFAGDIWLNLPPETMLSVPKDRRDPESERHILPVAKVEEKPIGQWNEYDILCKGNTIELRVNGTLINRGTDCTLKKGRIGLQSEGSAVEFKDISLQLLK